MSKAKPPKEVEEAVTKQVAALALLGKMPAEISREMNLSPHFVRKAMSTPQFKDIMKDAGDEAVTTAKNILRSRAESLAPEVWETIVRLVRAEKGRDAAEGLKAYFRLVGLAKNEGEQAPASMIINLPGSRVEKSIEVGGDDVSEDLPEDGEGETQ